MPDRRTTARAKSVEQLKQNIARCRHRRQPGREQLQVEHDLRAAAGQGSRAAGKRIDYHGLSRVLEEKIRDKYELAKDVDATVQAKETPKIKIHVIGFAKLIGELINGLVKVMAFFGVAALIATAIIYAYTRCVRSTALVIACSLVAVVWQLGLVALLGFELDPFSILVPFLVFAIGVSHGAQKMNGIMQDIGRGTHKLVAARYTFRRLFLAGLTALIADAVGFAVLMVIDIPVIQRSGGDREHRRRGADLHQPAAAAGAAVVHRRQRSAPRTQPARGARGDAAARASAPCGCCSTASRPAAGRSAPSRRRRCSRSSASR